MAGIVSVGSERLAKMFGVTQRHIQQLTQDGVLTAERKGRGYSYKLDDAVLAYITEIKKRVKDESLASRYSVLQTEKLEVDIELKKSQTELHGFKTDVAKGKYLKVEDVEEDYKKFIVVLKKFLNAIPNRVSGYVNGIVDNSTVRALERNLQDDIDKHIEDFVLNLRPIEEM